MFIVIYKPHGSLNMETRHIGPFKEYDEAYEYLCKLPAIGYPPEGIRDDGFKYIAALENTDGTYCHDA